MRALGVGCVSLLLVASCSGGGETATLEPTTAPEPSPTEVPPTPTPAPEVPLLDGPGPYAVGVVTLDLGDRQAEVWYPADVAPDAETEIFDSLTVFPEGLQSFIPEELSGLVETGAYRDAAPLADAPPQGFPLVIYSHGFGAYRQVATGYTTHLASWGYVVASTDHLERGIAAQATGTLGGGPDDQDISDVVATIAAVTADPVVGAVTDTERVVITGHSAGAGTAARAASEEVIDGYVSISGGAPDTVVQKPALVVIGELDEVVVPDRSRDLFGQLESQAVLVNVADGGHNSFTDSCRGIRDLGGLGALVDLIGEDQVGRAEDGCVEPFVEPEVVQAVVNHYTVAMLADLFGNPLVTGDVELALTSDVSERIAVADLDAEADAGAARTPTLAEFEVTP